jgi:lysophospholipase L1-like esterase
MMKPTGHWLILVLFMLSGQRLEAQPSREYIAINPPASSVHGRGWSTGLKEAYDRLPAKAEALVRKEVWNLSRHGAGLYLKFASNTDEIVIRYTVSGNKEMYHMPSTGVSGLDLYAKTPSGPWVWAGARASMGDTITYRYTDLNQDPNREYTLYFPLYNHVNWMEISYPKGKAFTIIEPLKQKPIVVYGTSIAQGGCASRPGLGWTNILGRKLDKPMINLAFSGNGRLEKEVLELIAEIDAEMYVLDCLPNLAGAEYMQGELKRRLVHAITFLQARKPGIPILLNEHAGYTNESTSDVRKSVYQAANKVLAGVVDSLRSAGTRNIYLQTKEEVGQGIESTVDGSHPNDIGMMQIAEAYDKKIRTILKQGR